MKAAVVQLADAENLISIERFDQELRVTDLRIPKVLFSSKIEDVYSLRVNGSDKSSDEILVNLNDGGAFSLQGGIHLSGGSDPSNHLRIKGTENTMAKYGMIQSPVGIPKLDLVDGPISLLVEYEGFSRQDLSGLFSFQALSPLLIGTDILNIDSATPVNLPELTSILGGSLIAASVSLGAGESLIGFGTIQARFSGDTGSLIRLTGNMDIGDSSSLSGFQTRGDIEVGSRVLRLFDANQAC